MIPGGIGDGKFRRNLGDGSEAAIRSPPQPCLCTAYAPAIHVQIAVPRYHIQYHIQYCMIEQGNDS
jgi:hypothetical protein